MPLRTPPARPVRRVWTWEEATHRLALEEIAAAGAQERERQMREHAPQREREAQQALDREQWTEGIARANARADEAGRELARRTWPAAE